VDDFNNDDLITESTYSYYNHTNTIAGAILFAVPFVVPSCGIFEVQSLPALSPLCTVLLSHPLHTQAQGVSIVAATAFESSILLVAQFYFQT